MPKERENAYVNLIVDKGIIKEVEIKYEENNFSYLFVNGKYLDKMLYLRCESEHKTQSVSDSQLRLLEMSLLESEKKPEEITKFITNSILENKDKNKFQLTISGTDLIGHKINKEYNYKEMCEFLEGSLTLIKAKGLIGQSEHINIGSFNLAKLCKKAI